MAAMISPASAAETLFWSFESDTGGWTSTGCTLSRTSRTAADGANSLELSRQFPGTAIITRPLQLDPNRTPIVTYHVFAPDAAGPSLKTLFFLKNKDGLWYQCVRYLPLFPGGWTEVRFDLSPSSSEVEPVGHFRRWSMSAAAEMCLVGIKLFSEREFDGPVLVDAVAFRKADSPGPTPLAFVDFRTNAASVPRFGLFELTFNLTRCYANPFDPDMIAVDAEFTGPTGEKASVSAFYYQDFIRVDRVTKIEQGRLLEDFMPVGAGCWKVRFTPDTVGEYSFTLKATDKTGRAPETISSGPRRFKCVPSANRGYIRVAADARNFEFSTGEPFYPIGHNVHSSNDVSKRNCDLLGIKPQDDHGTRAYEAIFRKMGENGQNLAEVWMASWSLEIEWTGRWKNYFGLGRYNLHHAWKLDRILSIAEQNGIYVHLVLENHGKASTFVDPEWQYNPFNEDNGGFLASCKEFFSRNDAREQYKKKLRYIIARWGYSTRIFGIELWSEIDLTGEAWQDHGRAEFLLAKVAWHRDITEYIKKIDHRRHLLTTHYSGTFERVQDAIVSIPGIDYIALDAYRNQGSIVNLLYNTYESLSRHGKPILVTEYGGSPMGTQLSRLEADLHAGIWSAYMMNHAGTPLLWWFMYVDRENKYGHYRALANYARGEDRRNRGLATVRPRISGEAATTRWVAALALKNNESAYVWVYDTRAAIDMPPPASRVELQNLVITLDGFRPGTYEVEFWDTYAGKVTRKATKTVDEAAMLVELPPFSNDIALKVKRSAP